MLNNGRKISSQFRVGLYAARQGEKHSGIEFSLNEEVIISLLSSFIFL